MMVCSSVDANVFESKSHDNRPSLTWVSFADLLLVTVTPISDTIHGGIEPYERPVVLFLHEANVALHTPCILHADL